MSGTPHTTDEDDEYRGYFIAKGTVVMGNVWYASIKKTGYWTLIDIPEGQSYPTQKLTTNRIDSSQSVFSPEMERDLTRRSGILQSPHSVSVVGKLKIPFPYSSHGSPHYPPNTPPCVESVQEGTLEFQPLGFLRRTCLVRSTLKSPSTPQPGRLLNLRWSITLVLYSTRLHQLLYELF